MRATRLSISPLAVGASIRVTDSLQDGRSRFYAEITRLREIVDLLTTTKAMIPEEKWFTTLPATGNVGSASIWVMLDAFLKSGSAKPGDRVLCVVPESGRAMVGFMMLEMME